MCSKYQTGFAEIEKIHGAIRDIDRIRNSKTPDRLDDVWNVIKDIERVKFDDANTEKIIDGIRSSLVVMYRNLIKHADADIGLVELTDEEKKEKEQNTLRGISCVDFRDIKLNQSEEKIAKEG